MKNLSKTLYSFQDNWEQLKPLLSNPHIAKETAHAFGLVVLGRDGVNVEHWITFSPEKLSTIIEPLIYENFSCTDLGKMTKTRQSVGNDYGNLYFFEELSPCDDESVKSQLVTYLFKHRLEQVFVRCFVRSLVEMGIPDADEIGILESESYAVVYFTKDKVMHFVDILVDWQSTDELEGFLGDITSVRCIKRSFTGLNLTKECAVTFE